MKRDRDLPDDVRKAIVSMGFIEDYLRWYLVSEDHRDPFYRCSILTYEIGEVSKHIVYKKAYNGRKWDRGEVELAIGQVIVNAIVTGLSCDIDVVNGIRLALEQIKDREWKTKG